MRSTECPSSYKIFVSVGCSRIYTGSVSERIQYKLCVLVHRCLNGAAPQYLTELVRPLSDVVSRRRLRSASTAEVLVPATRRATIGDRAFAVAGPRAYNSLPADLRFIRTFSVSIFQLSDGGPSGPPLATPVSEWTCVRRCCKLTWQKTTKTLSLFRAEMSYHDPPP